MISYDGLPDIQSRNRFSPYVVHALTSGEYSMGWKLEKIDSSEANGLDCFKVVKERAE